MELPYVELGDALCDARVIVQYAVHQNGNTTGLDDPLQSGINFGSRFVNTAEVFGRLFWILC